jgi:hypothetical protein
MCQTRTAKEAATLSFRVQYWHWGRRKLARDR